jgi:hypothetical protein
MDRLGVLSGSEVRPCGLTANRLVRLKIARDARRFATYVWTIATRTTWTYIAISVASPAGGNVSVL